MRLASAHARAQTLELARHPSFVVPTLAFPALFFLVFVAPSSRAAPREALASYLGFAVLGVAFFQFGVGVATDRVSAWEVYLRSLPVSSAARFVARIAVAALFALLSASVVAGVALATIHPSLAWSRWTALTAALLIGSVPFALLGIAIGYWATPRGALPTANLLYLGLSYAGGLWTGPGKLPASVEKLSPYLPTRQYGELLWSAAFGSLRLGTVGALSIFTVVFGLAATWGYRRDEGRRFR
jgi:ABC-2 type transport system permease protein